MKTVLIATIGSETQVVTLSLLQLADVNEVVILHTDSQDPRLQESLTRLKTAFVEDGRLQRYRYRFELLYGQHGPIPDVTTEVEAEMTFEEIFRVVRNYKLDGYRVHLNIAGGRKPMSIYGMVVAQMLFDEHDKLWHLFSNKQLVQSRRLFPIEGDAFQLVPIPVIRATDRPDLMRRIESAQQAVAAVAQEQQIQQQAKYKSFWDDLTPSEQQVAVLMVSEQSNETIAQTLHNAENTISKHLSAIYRKWRAVWGNVPRKEIRACIAMKLRPYLAELQQSD